ncbi:MAG TPA: ATP-grasp domain-containing protein, partial [Miltoncostaeaceae bacterium]|nr:ATP-grasp domain-containing protein [Miltoncostaeaceae bacterium]
MPVAQPAITPTERAAPPAERYDVGIAGAGQLARMTCLAAWPLGLRVAVLGRPDEPAAPMAAGLVEGDWRDAEGVRRLGAACAVVTLENEFVDAAALASVQAAGTPVRPGAEALGTVQDKALQKELLRGAGLPTAGFLVVGRAGDLAAAGRDLGWPLMLKARRLGYDGYGNATCAGEEEAREAFARLDAGDGVLAEGLVAFERELAVMVARSPGGSEAAYPVVETVQANHVCHEV